MTPRAAILATTVLLALSNLFMTYAWYGHLRNLQTRPWLYAAVISWGIAFFEYLLQVPANRWGSNVYSPAQLKIIQEVVTLTVFCGFAMVYLKEQIRWNYIAAFVCVLAAVAFAFIPQK